MLSRLLDPHDRTPRERVLWLVLAAVISAQLLAFYLLCMGQVHRAQARQAQDQAMRLAQGPQPGPASVAPAGHAAESAVPAAFVLR